MTLQPCGRNLLTDRQVSPLTCLQVSWGFGVKSKRMGSNSQTSRWNSLEASLSRDPRDCFWNLLDEKRYSWKKRICEKTGVWRAEGCTSCTLDGPWRPGFHTMASASDVKLTIMKAGPLISLPIRKLRELLWDFLAISLMVFFFFFLADSSSILSSWVSANDVNVQIPAVLFTQLHLSAHPTRIHFPNHILSNVEMFIAFMGSLAFLTCGP